MADQMQDVEFEPIFPPFEQQPWSQYAEARKFNTPGRPAPKKGSNVFVPIFLRDQFTLSTWMLMGASIQCLLVSVLGARLWIVALPVLMLGLRCLRTILQARGMLKNPYMEGVIPGKTTCHFPNSDGSYSGATSNKSMAVLLISVKSNHPLGALAPGFKELGEFFNGCVEWLEEDSHARGFLGMTTWLNANDRATSNELLNIGYFRNVEDIHALAHHAIHRAGWKWWNQHSKSMEFFTLTHEIFVVDAGSWENIFVNAKPTHLGTTVVKGDDGLWRSPLIRLGAAHRNSANRLRRKQTEDEKKRQDETDAMAGEAYEPLA
ncbi:Protein of unknown function DUF4188 [Kalmanozyma brasiliensis GHG001]|uniref:Uncharacterized protein n=1 Tax=Kalmanozyma brasiliensis (strain GHG001) TaxID=1365824 RepID=V5E4L6_KALBG|nr:Protein of unknown function DUF4188 [Kalmanozyma brasiliensis GHG001]EST05121.1 Protein of unknown function DUF4188 [Kalmanozyma brasiliensis GHG001]